MQLRQTGLDVIGPAPWGTHFCGFYATAEDLAELLVPYFKAGLEAGEFCMWVTSPPLEVPQAWDALARAVPDLDRFREERRLEIIRYQEWYLPDGRFEQDRVLRGWVTKLDEALARGCEGLRLTGNTFWLEKADWRTFAEYEAAVDSVLGQYRMLAFCTYSLDRCGAAEIADVIRNHRFALMKRDRRWELFESFDRRRLVELHARELAFERERLALLSRTSSRLLASDDPQSVVTGLCDEVTQHLGCDVFINFLVEDASGRLRLNAAGGLSPEEVASLERLDTATTICGRVASERRRIVAEDVQLSGDPLAAAARALGMRAYSCQPLIAQDRLIGTLSFGTRSRDAFAEDELELMQTVADQVATAVERIGTLRALSEANARLLETDRRKNDFLAALSHELRNPLAPVRNSLYVLDHAPPGSEQASRSLEVVSRQVEQLSRLVDDLLDTTRISRNRIELHRERLELNEAVRRAADDNRSLFERAQVQLQLELAPFPVHVSADALRLAQIVGNLLHNAAKFTAPGGHVRVAVRLEAGEAVLRVSDDGVGMAPEVIAQVFEPFVQGPQSIDRGRGGLGLGLALVKGLVELHGGRISGSSEGPGRGASFAVRLPADAARPLHAPAPTARAPRRELHRVLVVEDNVDSADSLRQALLFQGHEVAVAYDGHQGLACARSFRPDLVLCDLGLPGLDGYEVAQAITSDPELRGVVLVALSGYARPDDVERASRAGFRAHLAKPLSFARLDELFASLPPRPAAPPATS